MSTHKVMGIDDAEDLAPGFGMGEMGQARFLREALGAERIGMANYRMNPGTRIGFGHRHGTSEEMYVILAGSGRFKVEDDIFSVGSRDVVYCPPSAMRDPTSYPSINPPELAGGVLTMRVFSAFSGLRGDGVLVGALLPDN